MIFQCMCVWIKEATIYYSYHVHSVIATISPCPETFKPIYLQLQQTSMINKLAIP